MFQIPKGTAARDAISSVVILAACAIGIAQTLQYPARAAQWPLWMWGLLAALSVVLLFNSCRSRATPAVAQPEPDEAQATGSKTYRRMRIAFNLVFIIGFVSMVSILGFYTACAIYLCAHMYYLGIRPAWKIGAVTCGTLVVFYGMFEYFLGVFVPHGLIF